MISQFQHYLTFENIFIWSNVGIIPFWIMLLLVPNARITKIFVNSIILPLILATAYCYVIYQSIIINEPFYSIYKIFTSLDDLYTIFSTESFLLIFWLHFLALNLFLGSWISRDAVKYNISRTIVFLPLIFAYFTGPLGLVIYWILRIFFAKRLSIHD
tara:strand:+ start:87 stop:560 length:474 start_codon:yes stop_codon:yes gene_type:complete